MGSVTTKEDLMGKLDDLDKEEIEINKELRELQIRLNELVPPEERIEVKKKYFEETYSNRKKIGEPDYNNPNHGKLINDRIKINQRTRKMSNYFMKGFKAIGFEKEEKLEDYIMAKKQILIYLEMKIIILSIIIQNVIITMTKKIMKIMKMKMTKMKILKMKIMKIMKIFKIIMKIIII